MGTTNKLQVPLTSISIDDLIDSCVEEVFRDIEANGIGELTHEVVRHHARRAGDAVIARGQDAGMESEALSEAADEAVLRVVFGLAGPALEGKAR